ncbi:hypothetical protein Syun_029821 [Stephania yunnanensis]|uniref:Uncharacterized protein n=1 Tax=Stephania yunnanensis TaxID=152371 RepID=A0AAP0E9N0_9MAGN
MDSSIMSSVKVVVGVVGCSGISTRGSFGISGLIFGCPSDYDGLMAMLATLLSCVCEGVSFMRNSAIEVKVMFFARARDLTGLGEMLRQVPCGAIAQE